MWHICPVPEARKGEEVFSALWWVAVWVFLWMSPGSCVHNAHRGQVNALKGMWILERHSGIKCGGEKNVIDSQSPKTAKQQR